MESHLKKSILPELSSTEKNIFFANKSDINQLLLTYFNGNIYFSTYNNEILNVFRRRHCSQKYYSFH